MHAAHGGGFQGAELWRNTVVVLLGDNGFHLGDHGGLWAKLSAFDASTHVPLIMAGAGVPAGRIVDMPVELLDVYPTLLDLAGFSADPGLEGRSLLTTLGGADGNTQRLARSMVFHYDVAAKRDCPRPHHHRPAMALYRMGGRHRGPRTLLAPR